MGTTYSYASPGLRKTMLYVFMVLPTVVAVGFAFALPSLWGKVGVGVAAVAVTAFWYYAMYLRIADRLELTDTHLRWWTPKREGEIPLDAIRAVYLEAQNAVVDADGQQRLFVHADPGLPDFLHTLRQAAPNVEVDPGLLSRVNEHFQRGSYFKV